MLKNYFKLALKVLLRRKFFTFISLFAVGFTLIVLMVVSACLDHVFSTAPPEVNQDRTLGIFFAEMKGPESTWNSCPGYALLDRYCRNLPNVEKMAVFSEPEPVTSFVNGTKIESRLKRTDGEYWKILRFDFIEGGPITDENDRNADLVAVINEASRRRFFDGQPAVGKYVEADNQRFRVVGTVRNVPEYRHVSSADMWVPIGTTKSATYKTELMGNFQALLLARSPNDFPTIKQELAARMTRVEFTDKEYNHMATFADTTVEALTRELTDSRELNPYPAKLVGFVLVGMLLFMLLPTVNLVNINISRILERASEIGVRKAFGATSRQLVGQFIIENLVLTGVGGVIGFLGSLAVLYLLQKSDFIQYAEFRPSYRIFASGLVLTVFFGLLSGVYPAWKMSRLNPVDALKGGIAR